MQSKSSSFRLLWLFSVMLSTACGDQAPTGEAEDESGESPAFPDCRVQAPTITGGVIEAAERETGPSLAILDDTRLAVHLRQTQFANAPTDREVFLVDADSRDEEQLTANDLEDIILDAGFGRVFFITWPGGTGSAELQLWRDGQTRVLDESLGDTPLSLPWETVRWIGPDLVAWRWGGWFDERRELRWSISVHENDATRLISGDLQANGVPDVQGRQVVWSARDGGHGDILLSTPETRGDPSTPAYVRLTSDEQDDVGPRLSGDRIYFQTDSRPAVYDLAAGSTQRLPGHQCTRHAADAGLAAYVCWSDDADYLPQQVVVLDGADIVNTIETAGEIAALAMDGRALAWVVYESPGGMGGDVGTVYWLDDARRGADPVALAEIGSGCWYCDAIWPPVELHMNGRLVAWNYAMEPNDDGYPFWGGIGYAIVEPTVTCQP